MKYILFILTLLGSVGCSEVTDPSKSESTVYIPDWVVGKWQYKNKDGIETEVTLYPDGSAIGSDGSIGGWFFIDKNVHIVWTSGWTDLIRKSDPYQKLGFAPGVATTDYATNKSDAIKLP